MNRKEQTFSGLEQTLSGDSSSSQSGASGRSAGRPFSAQAELDESSLTRSGHANPLSYAAILPKTAIFWGLTPKRAILPPLQNDFVALQNRFTARQNRFERQIPVQVIGQTSVARYRRQPLLMGLNYSSRPPACEIQLGNAA